MNAHQWLEFLQQLGILLSAGSLTPLLVSVVTQSHWPDWVKQIVQVVLAIIVGVLTYLAQNGWEVHTGGDLALAIVAVVTACQIAYRGLWKKGVAPKLSEKTDKSVPK